MIKRALFWHRRDLRNFDNAGLYKALKSAEEVIPVFIFDSNILSKLPENDLRVQFIHEEISKLKENYVSLGSDLKVFFGDPKELICSLAIEFDVQIVVTNRDYEPYAHIRDTFVFDELKKRNIEFLGAKDHVIFEKQEVVKADGTPYTVFTPYMKRWKETLNPFYLRSYPCDIYAQKLKKLDRSELISLSEMGFLSSKTSEYPSKKVGNKLIDNYTSTRDVPSIAGTSKLSLHLRFGTISIRELCTQAMRGDQKYLNELIWRDFYQCILFHFPKTVEGSFKKQYDFIRWENNEVHFQAWCEGKTGYPLVDAGMRELLHTGHMHNRVRMVVASFLTKHLLIDWRLGERYFAEKLLDFELASNVGGWQWAAGSGVDAAPYFRVFNPYLQLEKFDPNFIYVKKWVPEFGTSSYPEPIIDHKFARERVLARFKEALNPG